MSTGCENSLSTLLIIWELSVRDVA